MKKMTAEELRRVALLTREWSAQGGLIPSQQLILDLQQHIAALESEATYMSHATLEKAASACADACVNLEPHNTACACSHHEDARRIRALKSRPAQEAPRPLFRWSNQKAQRVHLGDEDKRPNDSEPEPGVADYCPEAMQKPRREHEYGEEYKADFGSFIAECTRAGCQAFRVASRGKHHIHFKQHPDAEPTDEPGPCEVET